MWYPTIPRYSWLHLRPHLSLILQRASRAHSLHSPFSSPVVSSLSSSATSVLPRSTTRSTSLRPRPPKRLPPKCGHFVTTHDECSLDFGHIQRCGRINYSCYTFRWYHSFIPFVSIRNVSLSESFIPRNSNYVPARNLSVLHTCAVPPVLIFLEPLCHRISRMILM